MRKLIFLISLIGAFASTALCAAEKGDNPYAGLNFRLIGPSVGGRLTAVTGASGQPATLYAATAQGGLWKSADGGMQWAPIFDEQMTQSLGAVALAPSDPNKLYVGSGEANVRGNVALGYGIFVSNDGGESFEHTLKLKGQIARIAVDPNNADKAFAAVLGSPFGAGAERGIYRTLDGGKTWSKVLFVSDKAGASDVSINQQNPRVVFAGTWEVLRRPWALTSGGEGSGLYRSNDGGTRFEEVESEGLPAKPWGRVGVAVAPSDGKRVYALIEAKRGGLFRSDDGGLSFERISGHRALRQRAWYYTTMTVDPNNPDVVWFPQVRLLKTIDGGKTIFSVSGPSHGDHHDVWLDPNNPGLVVDAHDGGIDISFDGGKHFHNPKLPIAQFYNIDVDNRTPYHVGGTMQDMGTASGPSKVFRSSGPNLTDWRYVGGGEAGDFVYDVKRTGEVYAGEYGGYLSQYSEQTAQTRMISSYPANPSGIHAKDVNYRFQWTAPVVHSVHDGALYHGGNVLFRSTDQGASWTAVSPDLTRNEKDKQGWSGGPITGDITTAEYYSTIFSLAESPTQAGLMYAGTDDGRLHVTRDNAASWSEITPAGLPATATIESIHVPASNENTVYVVAHNYRLDDFAPYLFVSSDQGRRFKRVSSGLPADLPLWAVREDPEDPNFVYLGTERGVYLSSDGAKSFAKLELNLPNVVVTDIETRHGDLIVGTRGRSIWALENLAQLRALRKISADKPTAAWLPMASALRLRNDFRWGDDEAGAADGYDFSAKGFYYLASKPKRDQRIKVEIFDAQDSLVRTLTDKALPRRFANDDADEPESKPEAELSRNEGVNTFGWNLRAQGATRLDNSKMDFGDAEAGPLVPPGRYRLVLSIGDSQQTTYVDVKQDPRSTINADDLSANYQFARSILARLNESRTLIERCRAVRAQLAAHANAGRQVAKLTPELQRLGEIGDVVLKEVNEIESSLHNPEAQVVYDILAGRSGGAKLYSQLVPLYNWAHDSDHAPTQGHQQRKAELEAQLAALQQRFARLQQGALQQYRGALNAAGGVLVE
jgi:photosystem II stability/assembly factor-like uncharacterized protein